VADSSVSGQDEEVLEPLGGGWRWTALAVALVSWALLAWRFNFLCDDAYITFRYARNLAEGQGLIFNPGVDPPVEGYSEFLWAIVLATGLKVGVAPMLLARVLSLVAGALLIHGTLRLLAARSARSPWATLGAAAFLGSLPPLAVWSTGGMASMPFAAAVLWLFLLLWEGEEPAAAWKLGVLGAVVALLRADGAWCVAAVLGTGILSGLAERRPALTRAATTGAIIAGAAFLAHVGWRWSTYGDWLPNTARVKVGLSGRAIERGGNYTVHFLLTFPGVLFALLTAGGAWNWRQRRMGPALIMVASTFLYAVFAGGDFMAFGRFLVPALPFVALVLGAGLSGIETRSGRIPVVAITAVCIATSLPAAFGGALTPVRWRAAFGFRHNRPEAIRRSEFDQWSRMNAQAEEWVALGRALKLVSEPGDSVVYGAVGAIGYYSELYVYDLNGLVTRSVSQREAMQKPRSPGHDKTVPLDFFLPQKPDWLFAFWWPDDRPLPKSVLGRSTSNMSIYPMPPESHPRPGYSFVAERGN